MSAGLRETGNKPRQRYKESILQWKELGDRAALSHELECLGFIIRGENDYPQAACLLGAAEALRESSHTPMTASECDEYNREVAALRVQMDNAAFDSAWTAGRAMGLEEAVDYARR